MCLASFLMTAPMTTQRVFAAAEDYGDVGGEGENKNLSEMEIINKICARMCKDNDEKFGDKTLKEVVLKGNKKRFVPIWFNAEAKKIEDNPDPFRPAIKKEVINPIRKVQEVKPVEKRPTTPPPPPVKPIKIFVKGIVGNEGNRLAIVEFEKEEMTITKDLNVNGKFKVVDIYADRVVVYSNKEQRRHTFKIGGEDNAKQQ